MAIPSADRSTDTCALGVAELGRLYRSRQLSPVEAVQATLDRIARLNPELNAYLTVIADAALTAARTAEQQLAAGIDLGPLHGVPVAVKDNIAAKGTRTTAASRVLLDAPLDEADAPVVRRLRGAGAILVGKLNLHEFAFGNPDPEGPFGNVQNPRKVGHQSGSSSSGSGCATAAGLCVVALGTDTGGSIRHPASVCGVVGLKPTYGLASIRDIVPVSVHLDHVGPLARSVADAAAGLAAIGGYDPLDPYSVLAPVDDYLGALGREVRGLRMGIPTNALYQLGLPAARALQEKARQTLADLGLTLLPLELPRAEEANDLTTAIISVDLCVYHERHRDREALYGRNFRERVQPGRAVTGIQYAQAKEAQADLRRRWLALFERVDLLVVPANVAGAPPHGQDWVEVDGQRYPVRTANSGFNRVSNLTGFPALTLPIGALPDGLPIGIQLVGPPFGEARLLAVAHALEQALGHLPAQWGIEPRR
ncbi:MAG: amidase [Chloroflexi bacterium]|nr:amidase [Chloroflexota bacterium]